MSTQANHPHQMTPDELARATAAAMYENDACSRALGLEILEVRAGYARLRMAVRDDFLNGHQTCHGGLIFTLADSTFAFACNTYNINTVAAGCSIEFLKPANGRSRRADIERAYRHIRHSRHESRWRNRRHVSRQIGANQRQPDSPRRLTSEQVADGQE
jgi:phenylacetic acid degradation protein PaaD